MSPIRRHFWLLLGFGIIIIDTAVGLILYLIYRRLFKTSQHEYEIKNEVFCNLSCLTSSSLNKTAQDRAKNNAYQLDNKHDCDNAVKELPSTENLSHSYEDPIDYEQNATSGYVDVIIEDDGSYDDVIAPGWVGEDYDDIMELSNVTAQKEAIRPVVPVPAL